MSVHSLILTAETQRWGSCQTISTNLAAAYKTIADHKIQWLSFEKKMHLAVKAIESSKAENLIYLDHQPHPIDLFSRISKHTLKKFKKIVFHVYGDFTLFTTQWVQLERKLQGLPVVFVAASPRQKNVLQSFCRNNVLTAFFPVSPQYHYMESQKDSLAQDYGLSAEAQWILYTGRLSSQKNVVRLAKEFVEYRKRTKKNVQLVLMGSDDDIGAPFFDQQVVMGEQKMIWLRFLAGLSPEERACIHYLGTKDPETLRLFYSSCELFMSLSTYHDEDYGMSPAEALCVGIPSILTSWGGYSGFGIDESCCKLVPVEFNEKDGLMIQSKIIQKHMDDLLSQKVDRRQMSERYLSYFSIQAGAEHFYEILKMQTKPFLGFKNLLKEHSKRLRIGKGVLFPKWPQNKFYPKIYQPYYKKEDYGTIYK